VTDQVGFYRENGYVLVPGVFDDREVRAMRDGLDRILDAVSGTAHDRNHTWSAVGDSALTLKGFHDLRTSTRSSRRWSPTRGWSRS